MDSSKNSHTICQWCRSRVSLLQNVRSAQRKYSACLVHHLEGGKSLKKCKKKPCNSTSDSSETSSQPAGCYCSFSAARSSWNAKGAKESQQRRHVVREQRALSVPEKQPGGDFHPIGPSAAADGGACLGLRREP